LPRCAAAHQIALRRLEEGVLQREQLSDDDKVYQNQSEG
jgi:hypothetical protein